jgi:gliding motility-associated-like protein
VLTPSFTAPGEQCITGNSFTYSVGGTYAPYTTFNWNFGASASPPVSTLSNPNGITYSAPGTYPVTLFVKQALCTKTLIDSVTVLPKPKADFTSDSITACDPAIISFTNTSVSGPSVNYFWQFSDGTTSTDKNPIHKFSPAGVYNVTLTVISSNGCVDTSKFVVPGMVTVNVRPTAGFSYLPTTTTIFDPDIYFFDESLNATSWYYTFGDGGSSTMVNPSHQYGAWGTYQVIQTVVNGFGCPDTAVKYVTILPEFRFWIPNSFTPGKADGLNDVFMPSIYGVENYKFDIYNRWGERIFTTGDTASGWDGTYKGKPCQQDVYVWMITFKNVVTNRDEYHYGHVTLLK